MFKLLTTNIERLRASIPFARLSKTFQEAISFVRITGIEYIWIDSLCIIQDSVEDWQVEAALMEKVYMAPTCNIAATASSDGSQGLFRARNIYDVMPIYLETSGSGLPNDQRREPGSGIIDNLPTKLFVLTGNGLFWPDELDETPLSKRGWVFQESLLASRTLHFGSKQVLFECSKEKFCETFPIGLPEQIRRLADYQLRSKNIKHPFTYYDGRELKFSFPLALMNWADIVDAYSSRSLTFGSDKLQAFSGVAREFQNVVGWQYVAGMRKDCLLGQLL